MTLAATKLQFAAVLSHAKALVEMCRVADKNRKSLTGDNHYGHRFATSCIELTKLQRNLATAAGHLPIEKADRDNVVSQLKVLKSPTSPIKQRETACNHLRGVIEAAIMPAIDSIAADPVPTTEQVLPMAVVSSLKRPYVAPIIVEANGCYEHQWHN